MFGNSSHVLYPTIGIDIISSSSAYKDNCPLWTATSFGVYWIVTGNLRPAANTFSSLPVNNVNTYKV